MYKINNKTNTKKLLVSLEKENRELRETNEIVKEGNKNHNNANFTYDKTDESICCQDKEYFKRMFNVECSEKGKIYTKELYHLIHPNHKKRLLFVVSEFIENKEKCCSIDFKAKKTDGIFQKFYLQISQKENDNNNCICFLIEIKDSFQNGNTFNTNLEDDEIQIFECISKGYSHEQIADEMGICKNTLKGKIQRIHDKLSAKNSAHSIKILYDKGILL